MICNPIVSVIIPVFNVEKYLEETVYSIVNQTLNFKSHIQVILVNDGSMDSSESLCLRFREEYPENVLYLKQENAGVSSARNNGFRHADGKYVLFLDSDDKWNSSGLELLVSFLEQNDAVDFACGRLKYFDAQNGFFHPCDDKFLKGTRIIDVKEEPSSLILHVSSCLFKKESLDLLSFSEELHFSEDTLFVSEVLARKGKYGVVPGAVFYYRKRGNLSSAMDSSRSSKKWYVDCFVLFYDKLFSLVSVGSEFILPYVQNLVMYDMQWRFSSLIPDNVLSSDERQKYFHELKRILQLIPAPVVLEQKCINLRTKLDVIQFCSGETFLNSLHGKNSSLFFCEVPLITPERNELILLLDVKVRNNCLFLSGIDLNCFPEEICKVVIVDQFGKSYDFSKYIDYKKRPHLNACGVKSYDRYFEVELPISLGNEGLVPEYKFMLRFKDSEIALSAGRLPLCRLNTCLHYKFIAVKDCFVKIENEFVRVYSSKNGARKLWKKSERSLERKLFLEHHFKVAMVRKFVVFIKKFLKRKIWLVSDRTFKAGDNGESFFKFLMEEKPRRIRPYFVISKDSKDFGRLKKIGRVVDYGSSKYKLLFLLSSKIISSQAEDYVCNAFGGSRKFYSDLYGFEFVFLQHGIIKDDLSDWLHKVNKNIDVFVTTTNDEYHSIVSGEYYYSSETVVMTGIPRLDDLVNCSYKELKQIVFMPTWRQELASRIDDKTGERKYREDFKRSDYFNFYNSLINDSRLLNAMEENGYRGVLVLHPCFQLQANDFTCNEHIAVSNSNADYQKLFQESKLLVTDYSSVAFDFAYLKKTVLYIQFDYNSFFDKAVYSPGYFDYEKDGFGPVMYNLESLIDELIVYMESECILLEKYKNRIERCFSTNRRGENCKRILKEILSEENL